MSTRDATGPGHHCCVFCLFLVLSLCDFSLFCPKSTLWLVAVSWNFRRPFDDCLVLLCLATRVVRACSAYIGPRKPCLSITQNDLWIPVFVSYRILLFSFFGRNCSFAMLFTFDSLRHCFCVSASQLGRYFLRLLRFSA